MVTEISPEVLPVASGNKIIRLRPSSSTVVVKSVPRIAIVAEGVRIEIRFLLIPPSLPVINRAVPEAMFKANLDLLGSGSKIYSSIINFECSVNLTTESSKNSIASLPFPVLTSSNDQ